MLACKKSWNWKYWPAARCCTVIPPQTQPLHESSDITSGQSPPRNGSNADRQDGVDVRRWARRAVHARSCQTNGEFPPPSLAGPGLPRLFPPSLLNTLGPSTSPLSLFTPSLVTLPQPLIGSSAVTQQRVTLYRCSEPVRGRRRRLREIRTGVIAVR